jgi:hemerythrin-like domain-containing protein
MKRHKALYPLSHEHQQALVLARNFKYPKKPLSSTFEEQVKDLSRELTDAFEKLLRAHFANEERCLVPLFEQNKLINQMLEEHKKLEGLYIKIADNPDKWDMKTMRDKINLFGELLDLHIRFEERELFPMIEQTLTEEELGVLGNKLKHEIHEQNK